MTADKQHAPLEIRTDQFDAVIFDLHGVITDTTSVHGAAWKQMFDEWLATRAHSEGEDHRPFSDDDYYGYVDGKPRYDGVRSFLASRGISLPRGQPGDPPGAETVCGLGNRKDELFLALLREGGVALGLEGKPPPAVFLEAASRLGVKPERAAVVEDLGAVRVSSTRHDGR